MDHGKQRMKTADEVVLYQSSLNPVDEFAAPGPALAAQGGKTSGQRFHGNQIGGGNVLLARAHAQNHLRQQGLERVAASRLPVRPDAMIEARIRHAGFVSPQGVEPFIGIRRQRDSTLDDLGLVRGQRGWFRRAREQGPRMICSRYHKHRRPVRLESRPNPRCHERFASLVAHGDRLGKPHVEHQFVAARQVVFQAQRGVDLEPLVPEIVKALQTQFLDQCPDVAGAAFFAIRVGMGALRFA